MKSFAASLLALTYMLQLAAAESKYVARLHHVMNLGSEGIAGSTNPHFDATCYFFNNENCPDDIYYEEKPTAVAIIFGLVAVIAISICICFTVRNNSINERLDEPLTYEKKDYTGRELAGDSTPGIQ